MSTWSLLHMNSPLNTTAGTTGQIEELTVASNRALKLSLFGDATLSFSMPGRHAQTRAILPLVSDVLVFRDSTPVQRFRVVSRDIDWGGGEVAVTFAAVSYKTLLGAWIVHDESGEKKNWPVADGALNATSVAWTNLNYGQTRTTGALGITQGLAPTVTLSAGMLNGPLDVDGTTQINFLAAGTPRKEFIDTLAGLGGGFDWDINVDPLNAYTGLKFNVWSRAAGGRSQFPSGELSPFILDDGGNVLGGNHTVDPSDFGNVIRMSLDPAAFPNVPPPAAIWYPTDKDPDPVAPALDIPEGRWERDLDTVKYASTAAATSAAPGLLATKRAYTPLVSCSLRRGRWNGPTDLWLGDWARFVLTVPTDDDDPSNYLLNIDEPVRVYEVEIRVDDLGAEDVSLSLNRRDYSTARDIRDLYDRVARIDRR